MRPRRAIDAAGSSIETPVLTGAENLSLDPKPTAKTHPVVPGPADHRMLDIEETDEVGEGITARIGQVALRA